jgi:hypothetical protein
MRKTYIGIDPGENNGVAIFTADGDLQLQTYSFWELIIYIHNMNKRRKEGACDPHFIVENPMLNTFMYDARTRGNSQQAALKIARNVGMNQQDAKRIVERIKMLGLSFDEVKPNNQSPKWSGDYFNRILKSPVRCNQHERDAAKLISRYWIDRIQAPVK